MYTVCLADDLLHTHWSNSRSQLISDVKVALPLNQSLLFSENTYLALFLFISVRFGWKTNCLSLIALNDFRYVKSLHYTITVTNNKITSFPHSVSFQMVGQYIYVPLRVYKESANYT